MNVGMMWFDNDPNVALETKLSRATTYYLTKYGSAPNACYVHPTMIEQPRSVGGIAIKTHKSIRPGYFWIGVA